MSPFSTQAMPSKRKGQGSGETTKDEHERTEQIGSDAKAI